MLSLVYSVVNFYYECASQIKNTLIDFFENTPEKGLVENNMFLLGEHIFFSSLGVILFCKQNWAMDITMMWEHQLSLSIVVYYLLYIMRYVVQIQMMTGKEKDYQSMMTHHISTVLLLTLSFVHYHRIGVIIAMSHDLADLLFLPAKLCHKFYETRKINILNTLSYIYFVLFLLVFFFTRIVLNSRIVYYIFNTIFYPSGVLQFYNPDIYLEGHILELLLVVNLGIQWFWQIMIIKFAYNLAIGGKPKDEKGNEYFKNEKNL